MRALPSAASNLHRAPWYSSSSRITSVLVVAGSITMPSCGSGVRAHISATSWRTEASSFGMPRVDRSASLVIRRMSLAAISIPPLRTSRSACFDIASRRRNDSTA